VIEIVKVGQQEIATVHGRHTARIRGRIVSLVHLGQVFPGFCRERFSHADAGGEHVLVVIGENEREIALAVDRVIGEEDVVIKSIAENYRNVPGVSGASILGDGHVSLILDTSAMIEMVSRACSGESVLAGG